MLTLFRPGCKTATGRESVPLQRMRIRKFQFENDEPEPGRLSLVLPVHLGVGATLSHYGKPGSFPFCNAPLMKLCANLRAPPAETLGDGTVKMIDNECDNSVEFSELYMHLLNAAIGEMNASPYHRCENAIRANILAGEFR